MQKVIERILNLLAFLLTTDHPVSADEIRYTVAGYDEKGDEAFRRTFERDKELLRQIGIPLELRATDLFEVKFGYVIPDGEYGLVDPGLTEEERVARSILLNEKPDVVLQLVDAKNLERMLLMTFQLIEAGLPLVVVLNLMDEAEAAGITIDLEGLSERLRVPVVGTVATSGRGMDELRKEIAAYVPDRG